MLSLGLWLSLHARLGTPEGSWEVPVEREDRGTTLQGQHVIEFPLRFPGMRTVPFLSAYSLSDLFYSGKKCLI